MTNLLSSLSFNIVPQLQGKIRKRRKGRRMKQVMRTQLLKSFLICSKRDLNSLVFKVMVFWKLYGTHPRRPRGGQSGREKRRDKSFQAQAEKPLGTDSHRTISKRSRECWFLIGHKKCFVLLCPIGEQHLLSSFREFVHDYYYLATVARFVASFTKLS